PPVGKSRLRPLLHARRLRAGGGLPRRPPRRGNAHPSRAPCAGAAVEPGPCCPGVPGGAWPARPPWTAGPPAFALPVRGSDGTLPPSGRGRFLSAVRPTVRPRGPARGALVVGPDKVLATVVSTRRAPIW